jgi:tRNA modification GTPase
MYTSDTIAAIATAPGRGATALIRISGPDAGRILLALAPLLTEIPPPRNQRLVALHHPDDGRLLDRGLAALFPAPASYTGEDTVEISTHGGLVTPQLVLDATLAAGARAAGPGEFTHRAYLNGKLDLLQAEAVLDLIDGRSPALQRAAVHQMERGLSARIEHLRERVIGLEALMVYSIDFPEEDEPPVPPERIRADALDVVRQIDRLLATAPEGEMLREGALVVLAGRPNSGKSSLFNALIGAERAIVTDIPGTTRDALEAAITVDGYPFRLVDTAGLRTTDDLVEGMGIEVARRYLESAQIVLFCAEADRGPDPEEDEFLEGLEAARIVLVRTKADRRSATVPTGGVSGHAVPDRVDERSHDVPAAVPSTAARGMGASAAVVVAVSAHAGTGMDTLRDELLRAAFGGILGEPGEAPVVTRARHARALRGARDEVAAFADALGTELPAEFAAIHLRDAVVALEGIIGIVTPDDVLGRVFGDFCVGK